MTEFLTKILDNKPEYRIHLNYLNKKYSDKFSKKLNSEKNEINVLSLLNEIELGYLLHQIFQEVEYEPKINLKTPDWLVNSFEDKIIFEVRKINPIEQNVLETIEMFKAGKYHGNINKTFTFSHSKFKSSMFKIAEKEEIYRKLITECGYKLIIYFDVVMLPNYCLTENDIKDIFDFDNPNFPLNKYPNFIENVSGVMAKPNFGNKFFIPNNQSKYLLNKENIRILQNINKTCTNISCE